MGILKSICNNCGNIKYIDEIHLGRTYKCSKCSYGVKIENFTEFHDTKVHQNLKEETIIPEEVKNFSIKENNLKTIDTNSTKVISYKTSKSPKFIYIILISLFVLFIFIYKFFKTTINNTEVISYSDTSYSSLENNSTIIADSVYKNYQQPIIDSTKYSHSNTDTISDENKITIINLFNAENESDLEKALSFYSYDVIKYYDINNPNLKKISNRLNHLYKVSYNRRHNLNHIEKINDTIYAAYFDFEYYGAKKNTYHYLNNQTVYFEFDEYNRIIKEYDDR